MSLQLGPRKCETPGCLAPPCALDWDPDAITIAHKTRSAWVWECECGWFCRVPAIPAVQLHLSVQPKVSDHLNVVVDRAMVTAGEHLVADLGLRPRPVLEASREGFVIGIQGQFP